MAALGVLGPAPNGALRPVGPEVVGRGAYLLVRAGRLAVGQVVVAPVARPPVVVALPRTVAVVPAQAMATRPVLGMENILVGTLRLAVVPPPVTAAPDVVAGVVLAVAVGALRPFVAPFPPIAVRLVGHAFGRDAVTFPSEGRVVDVTPVPPGVVGRVTATLAATVILVGAPMDAPPVRVVGHAGVEDNILGPVVGV